MRAIQASLLRRVVLAALLATLWLSACAHQQRLLSGDVEHMPNSDVAALTADDIVLVLNHAGFNDDQILRYGPKVRNDLASSGGSRITIHNLVESIFAVHGEDLYVSSRGIGTFRYSLATHTFR